MPKVFGRQHLTFLGIYIIVAASSLTLAKLFIKGKKGQMIFIKVIAAITLICNIVTRVGVSITQGWKYFFPSTICSLTDFLLPIIVLCGKEKLNVYHGLWYIAFVGCLSSTIYADYISQNESIFFLQTFFGLLHHGLGLMLCIAMLLFNWFRPSIKKCYYFPMIFTGYIAIGTFALHVLEIEDAMLITAPIIQNTPINCWFILGVGTALEIAVVGIYELISKFIINKKLNIEKQK